MRRRIMIALGLIVTASALAAYQHGANWKEFHYAGTQLKVDLSQPDALVKTDSLAQLPQDLLKIPIARDVLTEDLVFYYEQDEDRLGLAGAVKRIAYEHNLNWSDKLIHSVFNEPAELAFWRDGKGALRHYALVMKRNAVAKVLQEVAKFSNEPQLAKVGNIDTKQGKATVISLQLSPRRTLLMASLADRVVVLSDPGLLLNKSGKMTAEARQAVIEWLTKDEVLTQQFALEKDNKSHHTLVVGAPTLSLGYSELIAGFKGLRFDYGSEWSTAMWMDEKNKPSFESALWRAAPANPSLCVMVPVNWSMLQTVLPNNEENKPLITNQLSSHSLACWYQESDLYSPVFVTQQKDVPAQTWQKLADWALGATTPATQTDTTTFSTAKAALAIQSQYVVFSPDAKLLEKAVDTLAKRFPSVADQLPANHRALAMVTPKSLSQMAKKEIDRALDGQKSMQDAIQTHLPSRLAALANYPSYRLDLAQGNQGVWHKLQWQTGQK